MSSLITHALAFVLLTPLEFPEVDSLASSSVDSLIVAASVQLSQGNLTAASDLCHTVLENQPNAVRARILLGHIGIIQNDLVAARNHIDEAVSLRPDDIETHYYRGIVYRELGKWKPWIAGKERAFRESLASFEYVVQKDSSYRDALLQLALTCKEQGSISEAVNSAIAELRLKPDLSAGYVGLIRLLRTSVAESSADELLRNQSLEQTWIGELLKALLLRSQGRTDAATHALQSLHSTYGYLPSQIPYLLLARIAASEDEESGVENYYWQAVAEIRDHVGSDLVFEDTKYVLTVPEIQRYERLASNEQRRQFFHSVWNRRNPIQAATTNGRLREHYQRLAFADKWYQRERPGVPGFAHRTPYSANQEFSDKGLIFIRLGKPDQTIQTSGENIDPNESWLYFARDGQSEMVFHFGGLDWHLVPGFMDPRMLEDRVTWGVQYHMLQQAKDQEGRRFAWQVMARESMHSIAQGLNTDRSEIPKKTRNFSVDHWLACFRGTHHETLVSLVATVPTSQLVELIDQGSSEVSLLSEVSFFDRGWRRIASRTDTLTFAATPNSNQTNFYSQQYMLSPDTCSVALALSVLETNVVGTAEGGIVVRDFSGPGLQVSDLIFPVPQKGATTFRGQMSTGKIAAGPQRSFRTSDAVHTYFEIYNLGRGSDGSTDYTVRYISENLDVADSGLDRVISFLFGGKRTSISSEIEHHGQSEMAVENLESDVSNLTPGRYLLTIQVEDHVTGQNARLQEYIRLLEGE